MALDHFVSQVHLKKFSFTNPPKQVYAIRKTDLYAFPPRTEDICRIENGSTNRYLSEPRAIEEFLKEIEPKYDKSLSKLRNSCPDPETVFTMAGFIAYVSSCSPTAMRLSHPPLAAHFEELTKSMDAAGRFPPPPAECGGKSLTDLLLDGSIELQIDPKYPQAIGIRSIYSLLFTLGNFDWEFLHNPFVATHPFVTSDYPVAIERTDDPRLLNKVVPLAPDLALRIRPNYRRQEEGQSANFCFFRHRTIILNREEVMNVNRLIVRCAESQVYFNQKANWITELVSKNSRFRIESKVSRIALEGGGTFHLSTLDVTDK